MPDDQLWGAGFVSLLWASLSSLMTLLSLALFRRLNCDSHIPTDRPADQIQICKICHIHKMEFKGGQWTMVVHIIKQYHWHHVRVCM
jgi:hypothetical protein